MRRDDQVFFFTLIDFFIQIVFLGFFLYVVSSTGKDGVSNFTALTDELSHMQPAWSSADIVAVLELINHENGVSKVKELLEYAKRHIKNEKQGKAGAGKPHCLVNADGRAPSIAEVEAFEDRIEFIKSKSTSEFEKLLSALGYKYEEISSLTLQQFKKKFAKVREAHLLAKMAYQTDCMFTIKVNEKTRYVEPRDAIRPYFYPDLLRVTEKREH